MTPPLRFTTRLALVIGILVCGWYLWGGFALIFLPPPNTPEEAIWYPRYFHTPNWGWVQIAVYGLMLELLFRGVQRRQRLPTSIASGMFFVMGLAGTLGPWSLVQDSIAGAHLFVAIILWRWRTSQSNNFGTKSPHFAK